MELFLGLITIGTIGLLAAMSPGPDFVIVTKNSLLHSRKAGIYTGIGVGLGIIVHVVYSLVGIGFVISQSILLFSILKYLGAAYLVYLGVQLLRTNKSSTTVTVEHVLEHAQKDKPVSSALREGFINSAINPKTTVFFLSIFTQVINPETHLAVQALYGMEIALIVALWFTTLAYVLSFEKVKNNFSNIQHHVSKVMGGLLVVLGINVALSTNK